MTNETAMFSDSFGRKWTLVSANGALVLRSNMNEMYWTVAARPDFRPLNAAADALKAAAIAAR